MKSIQELYPPDNVIRCDCGSAAFFDWGVQIIPTANYGKSPRGQDYSSGANVKICAACLKPAIIVDGDVYDASAYVTAQQVKDIIRRGQTKEHLVPAKTMDP